jgi:hypothetical protein
VSIPLLAQLLNQLRHQSRPSRLMASSNSRAIIAVEILIEQHQLAPVRVVLKLVSSPINRTISGGISQESLSNSLR